MRLAIGSKWPLGLTPVLICTLALTACGLFGGGPGSTAQSTSTGDSASSITVDSTSEAGASGTPADAAGGTPAANATPGTAGVDVTPKEVTVGGVTLSLSLAPARHMFGEQSVITPDPSQQQPQDATKTQSRGSVVFSDGMLQVANNIDSTQAPPTDSAQGIIRHVVVQVKTKDRGQPVPYLSLTMDVLLDGRPVIFDQGLAPMAAVDANPPQLYYGNNVKFTQRGTYQVFIRTQRNPLLGKDQPPAAQFNLTIR